MITDTTRIAAAQAYIDALVSHHGDSVPFAPGCTRIEQGVKNGFSGDHLRRSLKRGLQYRIIASASRPEFTVDGNQVRAVFSVFTKVSFGGRRFAAQVDETFTIPADGTIHHIKVRFSPFVHRS
jgi:hypothetical protein